MDKRYVILFKDLAKATAISAEQVMDYDKQKGDEEGLKSAITMRNDFQTLVDTIEAAGDDYAPNKNEVAKLLVAAMIQTRQLEDRIENLKRAMVGYQTDVIPKLQEVLEKATDNDDETRALANTKFIIENKK